MRRTCAGADAGTSHGHQLASLPHENACAAEHYDVRHDGLNIAGVEPFRYRMSEDRWWAGQDEINGGLVMAAGAQCAWRGWRDPGL
jgi:hypothetical protein